jgi:hypothetical protein
MTLADYDIKVRPHLHFIEAGAGMVLRHAQAIPCRMSFTTRAQDELAEAKKVLENALTAITAAEAIYAAKSLECEHA